MVNVGVTLSYRERDGQREYVVYVLTVDRKPDNVEYGEGAYEVCGVYWTLERAQQACGAGAWEKVDDMAIWFYTDEYGDHYAIQEVPVA